MNQTIGNLCQKIGKGLLAVSLSCLCVTPVAAHAETAPAEYEIYPTPHAVSYQEGEYIIRPQVNVVFESSIDDATKNRMMEVLDLKDKQVSVSEQVAKGKTNVLVGTYDSNEYVDNYVQENYSVEESLFAHHGANYVVSNDGEICILGNDTDGAFYGVTSLKHIFKQMEGSTIRNFTIEDYADTEIRGFIEGYYGNPWSYEDRMSLMEFGGEFKMTSYIFAPKDDPYHTRKWRELYPEEELAKIREAAALGNRVKCRFVWTAHPFMGGFDASNADAEIEALINKFEQLYEAGVRQFGVLGDDVGGLDRSVVIRMMNRVSEWANEKGDVYDTVFCPAGYNHAWAGNYSELNEYDAGFPEDVQIFWTGEAVCKPVEQKTLDHFRNQNATNGQRRAPLFWLNWPVNDINGKRLMMGKGSLLHPDINTDDLFGLVTNPMQEAEASKVALFAVSDYAWNVADFNDDKSWEDSFKYIDEDASESLHTLAKHMSNPQPNGHGLVLAESEELQPLLNEVKTKLTNGEALGESGVRLIEEMNTIMNAVDEFYSLSKNENLKKELTPFTGSLRDLTEAIKLFAQAELAIENNDNAAAFIAYTQASATLIDSQNHLRESKGTMHKVAPGSTHLIPLADQLLDVLSGPINEYVTGGEEKLEITASSSFDSFYSGAIENIIDGNSGTYAWYGGFESVGQYYQVNLSKPTTIYGIHVENGAGSGKEEDTFGYARLKYTTDGTTWIDVNDTEYGLYARKVDVVKEIANVVAVRYECSQTGPGDKWPSMREFKLDLVPGTEVPEFTMEVIRPGESDKWGIYSGSDANVIDGDDATKVHYKVRQNQPENSNTMIPGDYIGVKLSEPIVLGKIHILQGNHDSDGDYIHNGTLQYSMNGTEWTDIQTFTNQRLIDLDLSDQQITAQYVRLRQNAVQNNWLGMREFDVDARIVNNGKVFTNVDAYKDFGANYTDDHNYIAPVENVTLENGQYIGLKLDRIHELESIVSTLSVEGLTIEASKNEYEWEEVAAGNVDKDARYVRIINKTTDAVTFDITEFRVNTREFFEKSLIDDHFSASGKLNVFDGDWTTQTIYQRSQNVGNYFVYDLGQMVHFDTFKAVCTDSEWDFPRHAKFSVSADGETWTDIMYLGNQDSENPGESTTTDEIGYVLPDHEISYNTKTSRDLNIDARYLKFEITRTKTGADKWIRFQEFEINGGEYIPASNDPTFTSDVKETLGGLFTNMIDADISTMFIPDSDTGYVTYSLSEKHNVNGIKVIQNNAVISNAKVSARVYGQEEWVELGTLAQAVNEFTLPADAILLDIKLEWDGVVPNIMEVSTFTAEQTGADKAVLAELLAALEDTSTWTTVSKAAYETAIETGRNVNASAYASQSMVNDAVKAIENAIANKGIKGDSTVLETMLAEAETDGTVYTANSWKAYSKALSVANKALEDKDNLTQEMIDAYAAAITSTKEALVYNPSASEEATLLVEDVEAFLAENAKEDFTSETYDALVEALASTKALLEENETTPVHPSVFKEAVETLQAAFDNVEKAVYTVTVNGEVAATGAYNEKVTVTAPVVEGQTFTAWLLDGKVISTDETYTFFLSEDMDLVASYEEVSVEAQALLTNTMLVKRADNKADIKFVAQLVVPTGYTVKDAGLVWSSKEGTELSLENTNLKPTYITRISNTNQFSVTIKGMPTGKFIRGRIFATLVDGEGNETVVYSEEARVVNK